MSAREGWTRSTGDNHDKQIRNNVHGLIGLNGEEVMIATRQVGRAYDHKPAYVAVRGHVAYLRGTTRANEAFAFEE